MIEMRANTADLKAYAKRLKGHQDQLPYAIRLTLNGLAYHAMEQLRSDFKKRFTIRAAWAWKTILYTEAKKGPRPESSVHSHYDMLALHVTGGNKESKTGMVAVPVAARRSPLQKTTPSGFPGKLLQKKGYFQRELDDGRIGVFKRLDRKKSRAKGRGKRKQNQDPVPRKDRNELYWVLMARVRIQRGWPWDTVTAKVADDKVLELFLDAWDRAQATRRR